MSLNVVQAPQPNVEAIVERLEKLLVRARAGELETLYLVGFEPGGRLWFTAEAGKTHNRLQMIGILECLKDDLVRSQDVGDAA